MFQIWPKYRVDQTGYEHLDLGTVNMVFRLEECLHAELKITAGQIIHLSGQSICLSINE